MPNPLANYRRTQRELRQQFDAFTRANCPTCPTPCCRRPARILPTDILLAESAGWKRPVQTEGEEVAEEVREAVAYSEPIAPPCEFLGERGCTFPADLRPFGCTAYLCRYMHEKLDRPTLTRVRRLVRELEENHHLVLRTLRNVQWREEE
jgi:Fe-S-cluster containining protein